jgi:hypothetical protein
MTGHIPKKVVALFAGYDYNQKSKKIILTILNANISYFLFENPLEKIDSLL